MTRIKILACGLAVAVSLGAGTAWSQNLGGTSNTAQKTIEQREFSYDNCDVARHRPPSPRKVGFSGWCPGSDADGPVICVDATPMGNGSTRHYGLRGDTMDAGDTLQIFVRTLMTDEVDFSVCKVTGGGGADLVGMPLEVNKGTKVVKRGGGDSSPKVKVGVVQHEFKTYKSLRLKARVEVFTKSGNKRARRAFHEQTVTTVGKYSQALHIGIGAFMLHAGNVTYETGKRQGSQQTELIAEDQENVAVDILVGYTPYIGGRPEDGCRGFGCFAPYFGLSLIKLAADPTLLNGFYGGLDYELHDTLSIAFVAGLRRTQVPREDYSVGAPIDADSKPTIEGWRLSYGVMFNLSPTLLKDAVDQRKALGVGL